MNPKQKEIIDRIEEIRNQMEDAKCELALLRQACEQLKRERDEAIKRAEKAEARATKFNSILKLYGEPNNWRYAFDKEGNPLWATSLGPEYAMEILNEIKRESSQQQQKEVNQ